MDDHLEIEAGRSDEDFLPIRYPQGANEDNADEYHDEMLELEDLDTEE